MLVDGGKWWMVMDSVGWWWMGVVNRYGLTNRRVNGRMYGWMNGKMEGPRYKWADE